MKPLLGYVQEIVINKYFSGFERDIVKTSILPKISHGNSLIPTNLSSTGY